MQTQQAIRSDALVTAGLLHPCKMFVFIKFIQELFSTN